MLPFGHKRKDILFFPGLKYLWPYTPDQKLVTQLTPGSSLLKDREGKPSFDYFHCVPFDFLLCCLLK